ncbi:hypothetical protein ADIAL_1525 [Alkalibacterium sp. AK22]|nr:hypothetical protein ADIAL_1525 [Alkalibacterium sp. AK22]
MPGLISWIKVGVAATDKHKVKSCIIKNKTYSTAEGKREHRLSISFIRKDMVKSA